MFVGFRFKFVGFRLALISMRCWVWVCEQGFDRNGLDLVFAGVT